MSTVNDEMRIATEFEQLDCVQAAWHPDAGLLNVVLAGRDVDDVVFDQADTIGYRPADIHDEWRYDGGEHLCVQFADPDIRELR